MFTKRTEKEGTGGGAVTTTTQRPVVGAGEAASRRPLPGAAASASVVGSELSIKGNLELRGEVQIDGAIDGDVHAMRIVVGEAAHITGNLLAEDVVVRGAVAGFNSRQEGDTGSRQPCRGRYFPSDADDRKGRLF